MKQQLELDMEQQSGSKPGKEYVKAVNFTFFLFFFFNLYSGYIMRNAGLYETQTGIKITRIHFNNFWYADATTFMAESEEELTSLLIKVKEKEKVGLKLKIQKTKIMTSGPIMSCK